MSSAPTPEPPEPPGAPTPEPGADPRGSEKKVKQSMLQAKAGKHLRAAKMAGGGLGGEKKKATTTFAAKFVDQSSQKTLVMPWSHNRPLDELKRLLQEHFEHPEVTLHDAETCNGINSDPELRLMVEEWNEREGVRKSDALEAWILHLQVRRRSGQRRIPRPRPRRLLCRPPPHCHQPTRLLLHRHSHARAPSARPAPRRRRSRC